MCLKFSVHSFCLSCRIFKRKEGRWKTIQDNNLVHCIYKRKIVKQGTTEEILSRIFIKLGIETSIIRKFKVNFSSCLSYKVTLFSFCCVVVYLNDDFYIELNLNYLKINECDFNNIEEIFFVFDKR